MKNQSLGITGALVAFAAPALVTFGFTESCANEVLLQGAALIGAAAAWYGRYRLGDVTWYGARKA
jgi:hypothetical protein